MNNVPAPGASYPKTTNPSDDAAVAPHSRSEPVVDGSVPVVNSSNQPNAPLLASMEAAVHDQSADHPELGPEGIKYASSKPVESDAKWQVFSSKVVDGTLALEDRFDAEEISTLCKWLKSSPPELLTLNLKTIFQDLDADVAQLAEALKDNKVLTTLRFNRCNVGAIGLAALADGLAVNKTLTTLELVYSSIGGENMAILAEGLKVNKTLATLNVFYCWIGDPGAAALAEVAMIHPALTSLSLGCNNIGDAGAAALAAALKAGSNLASLSLESNGIGATGAVALADALETNKRLTTLDLGSNPIRSQSAAGTTALMKALTINVTLTTLDVSATGLTETDLAGFEEALKVNTTLTTVNTASGRYGSYESPMPGITALLNRNQQLSSLVMQAGIALDIASALQFPPEVMLMIAGELPLVPVAQRAKALETLLELNAVVKAPPKAD